MHRCLAASPALGKELCLIRHTRSALCAAAAAQPPPGLVPFACSDTKTHSGPLIKARLGCFYKHKQNRKTAEERRLGFVKVGTWDLARKENPNLHFFLN